MNWKRGFKRLTHILAILAGILGAPIFITIVDESSLDTLEYWESQPEWILNFLQFSVLVFGFLIGYWAVWLIYIIIKWLVFGFCDNSRLGPEKT